MKRKYLYVYQITNLINGMIYIGYHTTDKLNDSYMGSGVEIKRAILEFGKNNFKKEILKFFKNKDDMKKFESSIVTNEFRNRIDTYNKALGGGGLREVNKGNFGKLVVKDNKGNFLYVTKNDPRYLSGELVGNQRGTVTVKDKNGKTFQVNKNDPRYLSGELKHINTGIKILINPLGEKVRVELNEVDNLINNGYKFINDKKYFKFCPSCNNEMIFTSKHKLERSIKNKSNCRSCANSGTNNPQFKHGKRIKK